MPNFRIINADVLDGLAQLEDESVQCCITSPPYAMGQRNYMVEGQYGEEQLHDCLGWAKGENCGECYICKLRRVFAEVWRVLRPDGTLWLNIGDKFISARGRHSSKEHSMKQGDHGAARSSGRPDLKHLGYTDGDMALVPQRIALALQADGWVIRQLVIWHKSPAMPEPQAVDRPWSEHEHIWLATKQRNYFYNLEEASIPIQATSQARQQRARGSNGKNNSAEVIASGYRVHTKDRVAKDRIGGKPTRGYPNVWKMSPANSTLKHFAMFPEALPERCIKAGSREGDTILDPFCGAGTTLLVASKLGRNSIGIEINPEYVKLAEARIVAEVGVTAEQAARLDIPAQLRLIGE